MKKAFLFFLLIFSMGMFAQDQTTNGTLTVKDDIIIKTGDLDTTPYGTYGKKLYFGNKSNDNGDVIYMTRYNLSQNVSDLRVNIGDDDGGEDRFVVGNIVWNSGGVWKDRFVVTNNSLVGIGISNPTCALDVNGQIKGNKLDVAGTIRAQEVKIEATGWSDFVFAKDYQLPSLSDVEKHISENGTLPDIPSEQEVLANGIDVGTMQAKLLQKIEELTLYVIELKKENEAQNKLIQQLLKAD